MAVRAEEVHIAAVRVGCCRGCIEGMRAIGIGVQITTAEGDVSATRKIALFGINRGIIIQIGISRGREIAI